MSENTKRMRQEMGKTIAHTAKTTGSFLSKVLLGIDPSDLAHDGAARSESEVHEEGWRELGALGDAEAQKQSPCWDVRMVALVHDVKFFHQRSRYECARCAMVIKVGP